MTIRLAVISKLDHSYVVSSTLKLSDPEPPITEKTFGSDDVKDVSEVLELPKGSSLMLTRLARDLRGLFYVEEMPRPDGKQAYGEAFYRASGRVSPNFDATLHAELIQQ